MVSIPNVAHGAIRLALLRGRWDYTDKGLLDRTHLRFFTAETVPADLLETAALAVDELLRSTVLDPLHRDVAEDIALDEDLLPPTVVEWVRTSRSRSTTSTSPPPVRSPLEGEVTAPALAGAGRSPTTGRGAGTRTPMLAQALPTSGTATLTRATTSSGSRRPSPPRRAAHPATYKAPSARLERRLDRRGGGRELAAELEQIAASRVPRPRLRELVQRLQVRRRETPRDDPSSPSSPRSTTRRSTSCGDDPRRSWPRRTDWELILVDDCSDDERVRVRPP